MKRTLLVVLLASVAATIPVAGSPGAAIPGRPMTAEEVLRFIDEQGLNDPVWKERRAEAAAELTLGGSADGGTATLSLMVFVPTQPQVQLDVTTVMLHTTLTLRGGTVELRGTGRQVVQGRVASAEGTFEIIGGDGRYQRVHGRGTWRATYDTATPGQGTFRFEGRATTAA